jgi:hypothetical protein
MSLSIQTDHFLFDGDLIIRAFGHVAGWLNESRSTADGHRVFYKELMIEHPDGRTWHWTRKHGRWTTRDDGSIVDGWQRPLRG